MSAERQISYLEADLGQVIDASPLSLLVMRSPKDLTTDRGSGAVAAAVISLGQNLGLEVIAEGVETEAQKAHLLERGCVLMQGFLFAAAMPSGVFGAWVREREKQADQAPH